MTNQENQEREISLKPVDTPSFKGLFDEENWRDSAKCTGQWLNSEGTPMFFAESSGGANSYFEARCICYTCPVQKQCLEFAIENSIDVGIWGGLPYRERLKYLRNKRSHKITINELVGAMRGTKHTISSLAQKIGVTENYVRNQLKKGKYKYDNR